MEGPGRVTGSHYAPNCGAHAPRYVPLHVCVRISRLLNQFFRHIIIRPFCPALCSMPVVVALASFNCVLCTVLQYVHRVLQVMLVEAQVMGRSGVVPLLHQGPPLQFPPGGGGAVNQPDAVSAWGRSWYITFEPTKSQALTIVHHHPAPTLQTIQFNEVQVQEETNIKNTWCPLRQPTFFLGACPRNCYPGQSTPWSPQASSSHT